VFVCFAILFMCCLILLSSGLVSSVLSKEIWWKEHLQNDLFCVLSGV